MIVQRVFILLFLLLEINVFANEYPLEKLYRESQTKFQKKDYQAALGELQTYLEQSKSKSYKKERLLWVIDQVGFIYLRIQKDSNAAIKFFEKTSKDPRLDEAQQDDLTEWLAAAREWHKFRDTKPDLSVDEIFEKGRYYFNEGKKRSQYVADNSGNAHFHIAATYLSPFIIHHDEDSRVPQALLMMGTIRTHIHHDHHYMSENFYFKEVIRRKPHSKIAWQAYLGLEEHIRFGYSGSGGDNTPPSVKKMLEEFKKLAKPKKIAKNIDSTAVIK